MNSIQMIEGRVEIELPSIHSPFKESKIRIREIHTEQGISVSCVVTTWRKRSIDDGTISLQHREVQGTWSEVFGILKDLIKSDYHQFFTCDSSKTD